jgi:hypothetical protein
MSYILSVNRRTPEATVLAFTAYREYLSSVRGLFPPGALTLVESDWYFENHPHSPHDSWLETIEVCEVASGEDEELRRPCLKIKLLSSYHDGNIEFLYDRVFRYSFRGDLGTSGASGHGDWLWDEFTLTEGNRLVHLIEWEKGLWEIEAEDVIYTWRDRK